MAAFGPAAACCSVSRGPFFGTPLWGSDRNGAENLGRDAFQRIWRYRDGSEVTPVRSHGGHGERSTQRGARASCLVLHRPLGYGPGDCARCLLVACSGKRALLSSTTQSRLSGDGSGLLTARLAGQAIAVDLDPQVRKLAVRALPAFFGHPKPGSRRCLEAAPATPMALGRGDRASVVVGPKVLVCPRERPVPPEQLGRGRSTDKRRPEFGRGKKPQCVPKITSRLATPSCWPTAPSPPDQATPWADAALAAAVDVPPGQARPGRRPRARPGPSLALSAQP